MLNARERIEKFLQSQGRLGATNAEIVSHTGVRPHQHVFQITQALLSAGKVKARRLNGVIWHFIWKEPRLPA